MGFLGSVGSAIGNAISPTTGWANPTSYGAQLLGSTGGTDEIKSLIPGIGDAMAAEKANSQNIAAADRAMQFSERMSSTAYQRAMDDMKKAGLNPMLAFSQGGASAPQGVTPTINAASKTRLVDSALQNASGFSSLATARQQADTQQMQAESSVKLNATSAMQQEAQTAKAIAETEKTRVETQKARKDIPRAELEEKLSRQATNAVEGIMKNLSTSGKEQSRAGGVLNTFKNGIRLMFGPKKQSSIPKGHYLNSFQENAKPSEANMFRLP